MAILSAYQAGEPTDLSRIWLLSGMWVVLMSFQSLAHASAKFIGNNVAERVGIDAYLKTLKHLFTLDLDWHEQENSGNKLKRANRGSEGLNRMIRRFFNVVIEAGVNTVGIAIIFLALDWRMSLALTAYMVSFYMIAVKLTSRAGKQEYVVNKIDEDLQGVSFEALNNIKTLKALSLNHKVSAMISKILDKFRDAVSLRVQLFQARNGILVWYFWMFEIAAITYIVRGIIHGQYELAFLVLFVGYLQQVVESTWEIADATQDMIIFKIWVQRMMSILHTAPVIEHPELKQDLYPNDWQELKISNLNFSYEAGAALQDINLTIKRGEKVGIVGLSGAGKSTLFKLLMDLYENYDGDISLGNTSLKNMQRQNYIQHVAVVLQDTELFNASLKDNIELVGVEGRSKANLSEVLKVAQLQDLVESMPKGQDTVVGEKGVKLSGGERQRVGIARALYRQPDLLLMDEATSHLDVHSEKKIQTALEDFFEQVTAVVIAHRLSTIRAMDRIVVLQAGRIAEEGKFEDLIAKPNGVFAKMWQEQKL
jgi:ABC-type multidrug transport system fused ATPase/permease subunit